MGYIVGLCGIDGAGKSTVTSRVVEQLRGQGEKVVSRHELDYPLSKFIVRLASALIGKTAADRAKSRVLSLKNNNRPGVSFIYHILIYFESMLIFLRLKLKPGVIIHDRWPHDMLLQFMHRRYHNRLIWYLFAHFPRPNFLILLTVDPATAFERKQSDPGHKEDGLEYFSDLAKLVETLKQSCQYDAVIDAEADVEVVASDVLSYIQKRDC